MPTVSCVLRSFTNNWVLKRDPRVPFRSSAPGWSQPISFQVMPWSSEFFEVISAEKVKGWHLQLWLVCASFMLLSVSESQFPSFHWKKFNTFLKLWKKLFLMYFYSFPPHTSFALLLLNQLWIIYLKRLLMVIYFNFASFRVMYLISAKRCVLFSLFYDLCIAILF